MKVLREVAFFSICVAVSLFHSQVFAQTCNQYLLEKSQAAFVAMLEERDAAPDILSFSEDDYQNAALRFVRFSEACYHQLSSTASSLSESVKIDDGALIPVLPDDAMPDPLDYSFFPNENKWGASAVLGTSGGTVSYSFMDNGISIYDGGEPATNTAITSLTNYQVCFKAEIIVAFAAWSAVADIDFVEVVDNGLATNNPAANGLIRIGAHAFDGVSGTLAHAWAPLLQSEHYLFPDAGDLHFDTAENWTCDTTGIDIGVVALHEIGHSIGLAHSTVLNAIMYPFYNPALTGLDIDDIDGAVALYGPRVVAQPEYIFIKYGDYTVPVLKGN